MSFSKVYSAQAHLQGATIISIEADLGKGLHSFSIVGLPDKAVEESRDRISAAIKNSGFVSPKSRNHKVIISLAPADLRKEGPAFDVPMALAYLLAAGTISFKPEGKIFIGELSLDGTLQPTTGILPLAREALRQGFNEIYVPAKNAREAAIISGIKVFKVESLQEIISHFNQTAMLIPEQQTNVASAQAPPEIDFSDIHGQEGAKRALEIGAAGGHNIALYGPPGTGKTMLAKALRHLLPKLSFEEILEVTSIHSIAGTLKTELITDRPFRAPHHTSSYSSIIGGGTFPKPGEISLAHGGILFLDEFPEFDRRVIDSLRQPLEERMVTIFRAKNTLMFPANIMLLIAMNPCPCGNYGISGKECLCLSYVRDRYNQKISGPIIDRIDLWTEVSGVDYKALAEDGSRGESNEILRRRVALARNIQAERFKNHSRHITTNSEMDSRDIWRYSNLTPEAKRILASCSERLGISARAYHRIIKISRSIADLDKKEKVNENCILEALRYRPKKG